MVFSMSELSQEEIERIKRLRQEGLSYRNIARIVNRPLSTVYEIAKTVKPEEPEEDLIDIINKEIEKRLEPLVEVVEDLSRTMLSILRLYKAISEGEKVYLSKDGINHYLNMLNDDLEKLEVILRR